MSIFSFCFIFALCNNIKLYFFSDFNAIIEGMAAPGYIPLPEGIPAPPVPPVLAAAMPTVMTVPPPVMGASNSPAAPAIDTSQPPPNMSPSSKGVSVLSNPSLALPQITPRIPVMAKPGLMMPPFSFTSLPRKLTLFFHFI